MKSLLPLKELENLKVSNMQGRGVKGWPDVEVDFSSIFELTKLKNIYIDYTIVTCGLPLQDSTKNLLKNDEEYYDYEIIKDYDIDNERKYTILNGGKDIEKFIINSDKSYSFFLTIGEIQKKIANNILVTDLFFQQIQCINGKLFYNF